MNDENTDFFKIEDNFAKTAHISSIPIILSKLNFTPKITIAIPTYKRANLLKEALESSINQINFKEFEIIVVDNNPERGCKTEQLMNSYINPRITYYKNEKNLGMVGNWNRCLELTKTKWITILHDDDALHPNFLEYFFRSLAFHPRLNAFACSMFYMGEYVNFTDVEFNNSLKKVKRKSFLLRSVSPFPGVVFKNRDELKFNEKLFPIADYDFWYRLMSFGSFYKSNMKLAFYRVCDKQESNFVYNEILNKTKDYRERNIIDKWNYLDHYFSNIGLKLLKQFYENRYGINTKVKPLSIFERSCLKIFSKIYL